MADGAPPPGGVRDGLRARVYEAQHQVERLFDRSAEFPIVEVAGSHLTLPVERRFGDLAAVQRYVDGVLALDTVRRRWPRAALPVMVRERRGQQRAHYEWVGSVIAVPLVQRWALRELVVLHEIAHHLDEPPGHPAATAAHGPGFASRFVELAAEIIGGEAGFLLQVCLGDQGVPMR